MSFEELSNEFDDEFEFSEDDVWGDPVEAPERQFLGMTPADDPETTKLFDVAMVLAYAIAFIIIMLSIEKLALQPLERMASQWRGR